LTVQLLLLTWPPFLQNEIGILRGLEHANIVRLYDEFEDGNEVRVVGLIHRSATLLLAMIVGAPGV
jgi:serine/threonine protein kinase